MTPRVALCLVLLVGLLLRADGVAWDGGAHLHPDERYLSLVADNIKVPSSLAEYLRVDSPMNPYTTRTGSDLVYGTLPINATKIAAHLAGRDRYDGLEIVGRRLTSVVDLVSILVAFGLARLLAAGMGPRRAGWAGVAGAGAYALTPLAIQHAHFFVVDSWLTASCGASLLAAAHAQRSTTPARGAALVALAGALLVVAAAPGIGRGRVLGAAANVLLLVASAYLALRLLAPSSFASDDWTSPRLAEGLSRALEAQRSAVAGHGGLAPPSLQWLSSTPVVDPLLTLGGISIGPPIALACAAGVLLVGHRAVAAARAREIAWLELAVIYSTVVVGAYLASRFVHTVRYLLPLIPILCATAGVAVASLARARRGPVAVAAIGTLAVAWALAYTAIYRAPHTRVAASAWIRAHTHPGDVIVGEEWDDQLPTPPDPELRLRELPVYAPDDAAKLHLLWTGLRDADLVVLSSARASGAIGALPKRYPLTTRYYEQLLAGRLGFEPVARFRSRPRLAGVEVPDEWAEEATSVYDHPEVRVLRRAATLSWPEFRRRILAAPR